MKMIRNLNKLWRRSSRESTNFTGGDFEKAQGRTEPQFGQ